jgi:hypothetical protein
MISPVGYTVIRFEDLSITDPAPAMVVKSLAAMLASGFWYQRNGQPWLHDVLIGPQHIQDFKGAQRAKLRREIVARMDANILVIEGQTMTAPDVAALYASDLAFRRRCQSLPEFEGIRAKLAIEMPKIRTLNAKQYERSLILPMHGNVEIKSLLAKEYEDG